MNGELIRELRELEKSDQLPSKVSNRLVLTAVIQLYSKVEEHNKFRSRMARLEGTVALQTVFLLAAVGWILYGA